MRLKPNQSEFVARKIAIDLVNAPFVKLLKGTDGVAQAAKEIIDKNLAKEKELDGKVKEILDEHYDDIELQQVDERQLFFMIKKRLAPDFDVIMNYDDRYSDISHKILDELYEEYLIEYEVNDNQVKNIIFNSFREFAKSYEEIDDIVYDKIRSLEKEVLAGSEEYEILYERYFKEELSRRGML
ncbi:MAG: DUF507 domain-containing protein [Tenericutes bacterium]|nr:MAG: DUF507 domain-containing protein [Mycoplasmatota bacterium]